jgi:hypothetical protein
MASRHSLQRVAKLTKKVHDDLRRGGMGMTFRYLFRSTAILARVVSILADHVAAQAEAEHQSKMLRLASEATATRERRRASAEPRG